MDSTVIPAPANQDILSGDDWYDDDADRFADDWDGKADWKTVLTSERSRLLWRQLRPAAVGALGLGATAAIGSFLAGNVEPSALPDPVPAAARLEAMWSERLGPSDISMQYVALADEMVGGTVPDAASGDESAAPFVFARDGLQKLTASQCLATAAWYEAGDDPVGQRSVMQVVLNRVRHPAFPNSICGVVFQGSQLATGCQFTFTCDGSMVRRKPPAQQWSRAMALSQRALSGDVDSSVREATHYHADYVTPWWSPHLRRVAKVGSHIFYRWDGEQGIRLSSSSRSGEEVLPSALYAQPEGGLPAKTISGTPDEPTSALAGSIASAADAPAPVLDVPGRQVVQLSSAQSSGRWAVEALGHCANRASCQVVGYQTGAKVSQNRGKTAVERPDFLFVRDAATGRELALWNCARITRPNASQCLPTEQGELNALLRAGLGS